MPHLRSDRRARGPVRSRQARRVRVSEEAWQELDPQRFPKPWYDEDYELEDDYSRTDYGTWRKRTT